MVSEEIINALNNLQIDLEEIKKYTISNNEKLEDLFKKNKNTNEYTENKRIEIINDYTKIVLKNLESRISILEEESQNYNRNN